MTYSSTDNVSAGREYVKAYVPFVHYAERIYKAATAPVEGHDIETEQGENVEKLATAEEAQAVSVK